MLLLIRWLRSWNVLLTRVLAVMLWTFYNALEFWEGDFNSPPWHKKPLPFHLWRLRRVKVQSENWADTLSLRTGPSCKPLLGDAPFSYLQHSISLQNVFPQFYWNIKALRSEQGGPRFKSRQILEDWNFFDRLTEWRLRSKFAFPT